MKPYARTLSAIAIPLIVLLASACVSQVPTQQQFERGYVGAPVGDLIEAAMRPESYPYGPKPWPPYPPHPLPDGHFLYVIPSSPWCTKHVEADAPGIITDIRWLAGCRPGPALPFGTRLPFGTPRAPHGGRVTGLNARRRPSGYVTGPDARCRQPGTLHP